MSVVAIAIIALLVALLLNEDFRGRRLLGAVLLVPWAIPYVANALMWKWIYDSNYGALNGLLLQLGFIDSYMVWLGDTRKTLALIAQAFVWKEVPLAAILILVGLKTIPADLYAAAKVDGANLVQRFFHVTLPALKPSFRACRHLRSDDGDPALRSVLHSDRRRSGQRQRCRRLAHLRRDVSQPVVRHRRRDVLSAVARHIGAGVHRHSHFGAADLTCRAAAFSIRGIRGVSRLCALANRVAGFLFVAE